jgi:putative endonuclease
MPDFYILKSEQDGTYYVGSTSSSSEQRLVRHNNGYSKYTKNKRPWAIVYKEIYETTSSAKKREYYVKSLKSKVAIEKLIKSGAIV